MRSPAWSIGIGAVLIILGLLPALLFVVPAWWVWAVCAAWTPTTATVEQVSVEQSGRSWFVSLSYRYPTADGTAVGTRYGLTDRQITREEARAIRNLKPASTVEVLVDPGNPQRSLISRKPSSWLWAATACAPLFWVVSWLGVHVVRTGWRSADP